MPPVFHHALCCRDENRTNGCGGMQGTISRGAAPVFVCNTLAPKAKLFQRTCLNRFAPSPSSVRFGTKASWLCWELDTGSPLFPGRHCRGRHLPWTKCWKILSFLKPPSIRCGVQALDPFSLAGSAVHGKIRGHARVRCGMCGLGCLFVLGYTRPDMGSHLRTPASPLLAGSSRSRTSRPPSLPIRFAFGHRVTHTYICILLFIYIKKTHTSMKIHVKTISIYIYICKYVFMFSHIETNTFPERSHGCHSVRQPLAA